VSRCASPVCDRDTAASTAEMVVSQATYYRTGRVRQHNTWHVCDPDCLRAWITLTLLSLTKLSADDLPEPATPDGGDR